MPSPPPIRACSGPRNRCPVLRFCPICAKVLSTVTGRIRHMVHCPGPIILSIAEAQHFHDEQFHSPKNLSMALAGECGELLEHFQWLSEAQSASLEAEKKVAVGQELADILIYLIRLAERLDIDLIAAAETKIALNEQRYPVARVRGDARRADEYASP